jgi:hypothetical protein
MRPVVFDLLSGLEMDGQKSLVGPVGRESLGSDAMAKIDPQFVDVMRRALEEVMTKVPLEYSTSSTKAYLAECILKAAAQGRTTFDELVVAASDQIQSALSLFT